MRPRTLLYMAWCMVGAHNHPYDVSLEHLSTGRHEELSRLHYWEQFDKTVYLFHLLIRAVQCP